MKSDYAVTGIRWLTEETFVLSTERKDLKFDAGQLVSLGPRGMGVNREYSVYSGEKDSQLEFLVRKVRGGTVSVALAKLKPGDLVFVLGPYSDFRLKELASSKSPIWFIATGTGIAPFRSMVRSNPDLDFKVIHGVREPEERYDFADYPAARYQACISGKDAEKGGAFRGRVTDYLRSAQLPKNGHFYLCGNNKMITDAYAILREAGVSSNNIHSEVFF